MVAGAPESRRAGRRSGCHRTDRRHVAAHRPKEQHEHLDRHGPGRLDRGDEVAISSRRADGTLRPFVTIWGVRVGDSFFIRSAQGPSNGWFRRALTSGTGAIRGNGAEVEVAFTHLGEDDSAHDAIDAAYHAKYDSYGARIVGSVTGDHARAVTLRLDPA